MGQTLDKIEEKLGSIAQKVEDSLQPSSSSSSSTPSSSSRSPTHYDYSHLQQFSQTSSMSSRLTSSLHSYPQLVADVRLLNLNYSKFFVGADGLRWRFHILSRMKADVLMKCRDGKGEWTKKNNVVIVAGRVGAEKTNGIARSPPTAPSVLLDAATTLPTASSLSSSSPSPTLSLPDGPLYTLTLREFYFVFLYYCDHVQMMQVGARKTRGKSGSDADVKATANPDDDDHICSICLANDIEIVLKCGHAYCTQCIADWTEHHEQTCPLCRQGANVEGNENWDLMLESKDAVCDTMRMVTDSMERYISQKPNFTSAVTKTSGADKSPLNPIEATIETTKDDVA